MNKIGFTNFRKFTNFPTINLGGVTILVGGNNAGKSTLVKAMLLMGDFIQTRILNGTFFRPVFKFDAEHVNIGNFSRAFCRKSKKSNQAISFNLGLEEFIISVEVKSLRNSEMEPYISYVRIADSINNVYLTIDYELGRIILQFVSSDKNKNISQNRNLEKELNKVRRSRFKSEDEMDLEAIVKFKAEEERLIKALEVSKENDVKDDLVNIELNYIREYVSGNLFFPEMFRLIANYPNQETLGNVRSYKYKLEEADKAIIKSKTPLMNNITNRLNQVINNHVLEYIYAHSISQQVFYNIVKDSNDYVTRVIHEFYQARITKGDEEFKFLQRWMEEFEIGTSIEVISMKGEAYQVLVYDKDNKKGIDLADKGMGSIQMTILLLRIATLIRMYKGTNLTIILEEPEQNLHPALQSKLADLLLYIQNNYGFHFVVETHSEYLVRKTQVIVASLSKCNNRAEAPFKCYYLPNDGKLPYEMIYREDGNFSNEFGEGFFDTATKLLYDIL